MENTSSTPMPVVTTIEFTDPESGEVTRALIPQAPLAPGTYTQEEIEAALNDLFVFHSPTQEQVTSYGVIREHARDLAFAIMKECPAGPDRTAAVRKVREAVMTANASIATHNAAAKVR